MKAYNPHSSGDVPHSPKKLINPLQGLVRTLGKINYKSLAITLVLLAGVGVTTFATTDSSTIWFTKASGEGKITYTADQLVNEDGRNYTEGGETWFGNGESRSESFLGIHFAGEPLPEGATIKKVELKVVSAQNAWITQSSQVYIQNATQASLFSSGDRPSQRPLTADSVRYSDNKEWKKDTAYVFPSLRSLASVLQAHKGSFALIVKGGGGSWARKFIKQPVTLEVTYTTTDPKVTPMPQPTSAPGPTDQPQPTPVPTQTPPPGQSPQPTQPPAGSPSPAPQPTADPHAGHGQNSHAMGLWDPVKQGTTQWDVCPNPADTARIKEIHDSYSVIGPDGKRYPTWHPPVDPATGCKFGHEHGRDPRGYAYWDEIRRNFAHDADGNGQISDAELVAAGIPFGYVNEQIDMASMGIMRHEDHVGHKIEFVNGEGDIGSGTDPFDNRMTGGLVVPVKTGGLSKWSESGVRCYHFHKVHQGVHSPDAFGNNMHEVVLHTKCSSTRADYPASTTLLSGMITFGAPGEFTIFCGNDRNRIQNVGKTDANKNWPGVRNNGFRNIINRSCVQSTVLVPEGQWSAFPYEIWSGGLSIRTASGQQITAILDGSWEILDAIRYYDDLDTNSAISKEKKMRYMIDVCYETLGNRRTRGGACDWGTNYGKTRNITWNDPRSPFRGVVRGQYVAPPTYINNANGPQYWYTDAFGGNASRTPFPGSIRQLVSPVTARITFSSDPRIIQRNHNDGNGTVHAPN